LRVLAAGNVVFEKHLVDPNGSQQWTIGFQSVSPGGFYMKGIVYYHVDRYFHECLELQVDLYQPNDATVWAECAHGIQFLYLDEPEEQQHVRQDLLNGYISFRLERF
jgi:hypothetical protein